VNYSGKAIYIPLSLVDTCRAKRRRQTRLA
jgi:hypothetical protein